MSEQRQKENLFSVVNTLHRTGAIDSEQRQRLLDAVGTHRHYRSEEWFKRSSLIQYLNERERQLTEAKEGIAEGHKPKTERQREIEKVEMRRKEAKRLKTILATGGLDD